MQDKNIEDSLKAGDGSLLVNVTPNIGKNDEINIQSNNRLKQLKKLKQLKDLRDNPKPSYNYFESEDDQDEKILFESSGETVTAPKGTGQIYSEIENDISFDNPTTTLESIGAQFDKLSASMVLTLASFGAFPIDKASEFVAKKNKDFFFAQENDPEYMNRFNRQWSGSGVFGKVAAVLSNPRAIGRQIVTQAPNAVLPIMTTFAGAKLAGVLGSVVGAFTGSSIMATAETMDEIFVRDYGASLQDAESVFNILNDPQKMKDIKIKAVKAGASLGVVDAIFQVFGGSFLKSFKNVGTAGKVVAGTADVLVQSGGEVTGEAVRQYSAFKNVDWDEALLEGVISLSTSVGQTAIGATVGGGKQIITPEGGVVKEPEGKITDTQEPLTTISGVDQNRLFELDKEALDTEIDKSKLSDVDKLISIMGEENAVKFLKLERKTSSSNPIVADKAIEDFDLFVEGLSTTLTEDQINSAFELDALSSDDIKAIVEAKNKVDFFSSDPIAFVSSQIVFAMMKSDAKSVVSVPEKGGDILSQESFIIIQGGINDLINKGVEKNDIASTLVGGIVKNGGATLEQATEIVDNYMKTALQSKPTKEKLVALEKTIEPAIKDLDFNKTFSKLEIASMTDEQRETIKQAKLEKATNAKHKANIEAKYSPDNELTQLFSKGRKKGVLVEKAVDTASDLKRMVGNALTPISTRLKNINPKLRAKLRRFEFNLSKQINKDMADVLPFLEKYKSISSEHRTALDFAMKNGDEKLIADIAELNGMQAEIETIRKTLDEIYNRAETVNYDIGYRKGFYPRNVAKHEQLVAHFEDGEAGGEIIEAIKKKELELGVVLSVEEKASLINTLLRGYNTAQISLSTPGALKERNIDRVTPDINEFYDTSDQALIRYISIVNEAIEARKFFGVTEFVKKDITSLEIKKQEMKLKEVRNEIEKSKDFDEIKKLQLKESAINSKLDKLIVDEEKKFIKVRRGTFGEDTKDIQDSIGFFVLQELEDGKINSIQAKELSDILNARFNRGRMSTFWRVYKNFSYIDTMGSTTSALTQIGDLAFSMYKNGVFRTLKVLPKAVLNKSEIKRQDVGVEKIAQEFEETSTSATAVNKVFKLVGLDKIDAIGKEVLINGALDRYRKLSIKPSKAFLNELEIIFEDETQSVISDLRNKINSDNIKLLVGNELMNFQPIALSEMPAPYLTSGNGRMFYMLKTFTIKQLDIYRNEVFAEIRSGDPIKGMKNLTRLLFFFVTMNAGADFLKDLLLGRETPPEDYVVNNILRLFGVSKFQVYTARREGIGTAAAKTILPPFKAIDALYKDINKMASKKGLDPNDMKVIASIPVVGKLYYWWFGGGLKHGSKSNNKKPRTF